MSTCSRSSANPPGTPPTTVVASSESPAAFKFWASQSVGNFSDNGFRAWLYSFEDYCDTFNLSDTARLKEVDSKLCDDARIWHQDMLFNTWDKWKAEAKKRFIGYEPDPHHLLNQVEINQFTPFSLSSLSFRSMPTRYLHSKLRAFQELNTRSSLTTSIAWWASPPLKTLLHLHTQVSFEKPTQQHWKRLTT
ncbi:hypothetical protein DSO57_1039787 [Entomophthora muscae]|uniref:Uncharacterized protein n=1 Tax=Entomophthora muscae TaxID=34485 RepID=A0ACC2SIG6_9FUNG|nr:hypothetical protein DSO57_1039787 [Entomophthora muscae]